jgi:hypothetical protein
MPRQFVVIGELVGQVESRKWRVNVLCKFDAQAATKDWLVGAASVCTID